MLLKELIKSAGLCFPDNAGNFQVKGITSDSRRVRPGFVFVAVCGSSFDGHKFIPEAIRKGAKVIICEIPSQRPAVQRKITYIKTGDTRRALAELLNHFHGQPSLNLKVVGITGTNGKTTVSYLIEAILKYAHFNPAVIGTINYRFKQRVLKADNTTPAAELLQPLLARMRKAKVDYVITEVSSHALDQQRVESVKFSSAIFTNLTQDHLDYHRDLNSYFFAKSRLFRGLEKNSFAVVNLDDARAGDLIKSTRARVVTYGILNKRADVSCRHACFNLKGTEFSLRLSNRIKKNFPLKQAQVKIATRLIGRHNLYNILAAAAFSLVQGIGPQIIAKAVGEFRGVPGRLEKVTTKKGFTVFIDYAHTEDALINVISSLRPLCKGRLLVVFGCGGSRDKTKRPKMGRAVTSLADLAIITSDNPRNEDPKEIIKDIIAGIEGKNYRAVPKRREAIKEALSLAGNNDIILIAGKGHEHYQVFKDRVVHFDDREAVRECLGLKK
ncbi:UDP-N-acetylmuramoyl-L-alanyl-D-glutamate--2,6-diaminopimelate ligase [Candidatus Omnitrophota bacterium]